jgi:hypothetical protein
MKIETIQIKKKDKVEEWKLFKFDDGKTFRFTNKMFLEYRVWREKYLSHFQYKCFFIPEKNLFIDKEKKDRVIILPTSTEFKINSDYTLLAKDNNHTMMLINHNDDILIEYEIENKKRYVWFGSQTSNDEQAIQIIEVQKDVVLDIETMKKINKRKNNIVRFQFLEYFTTSIADDIIKLHKGRDHRILVAENAQHVRALDCYTSWKNVLLNGNKKYIEVEMYKKNGIVYTYHLDDIPLIPNDNNMIEKAIKDDKILHAFAEIPNLDIEITIKTWVYNAESHYSENSFYCEAYQCEVSDYTEYSDIKLIKEEKVKLSDLLNVK